jgi:hypothetical protein
MFKIGDKIRIILMKDEENYNGREGFIEHIDDFNQLHGTWGSLAIVPTEDIIEIISESLE